MLFNSLDFLLFFIVVFAMYWAVPSKWTSLRNVVLLVASYVFYGYWDWRFLGLIIISTLVDYSAARGIIRAKRRAGKKGWLWASILVNLGMLGYFKYFNFFAGSLASILNDAGLAASYSTLNIVLPVGISFYTFQTLSYTIDVYRGQVQPTKNILQFAVFVAFFPQLVAGPIERAANLLPQFANRIQFHYSKAVFGLLLMVYGFFKKLAVADNISLFVDPVFENPELFANWQILLSLIGFGFQIYADFSGYSDIAIGLASVFGFHLNTNFKTPFFAGSIREFWSRWHISLSTWFRDYVYISLGGNRIGLTRKTIHVLLTFGVSGLWHGANFNFILWGLLHGAFYSTEQSYARRVPRWVVRWLALLGIFISWGVFRLTSFKDMALFYQKLFDFDALPIATLDRGGVVLLMSLLMFGALDYFVRRHENFAEWLVPKRKPVRLVILYSLVIWTLLFGAFETEQSFIYFQF